MDADRALSSLSRSYRLALSLRRLGADDQLIADCLDLELRAVEPLVEIGRRKLQLLEGGPPSGIDGPAEFSSGY